MQLGTVISETRLELPAEFNQFTPEEYTTEHFNNLPILYVGMGVAKEALGEDFNILHKQVSLKDFWTFTLNERRQDHQQDVMNFTQYCYKYLVTNTDYYFVDPIHLRRKDIKKILYKIKSFDNAITYIHENEMAYIYSDSLILGIDLKLLEFMGFSKTKIISKLRDHSQVVLTDAQILIEYKTHLERLDNQPKYVPFLYSISKHE